MKKYIEKIKKVDEKIAYNELKIEELRGAIEELEKEKKDLIYNLIKKESLNNNTDELTFLTKIFSEKGGVEKS